MEAPLELLPGDTERTGPRDPWAPALHGLLAEPSRVRTAFQPIVALEHSEVAAYEALARFDGSAGARPALWFAAAERLGLLPRLEALTLRAALFARASLPPNCFLAVNVSPAALVTPEAEEVLGSAGELHGVALELTETHPVVDYERLLAVLDVLRDRGAVVAVDDAGAGYASLRHVMALRPEFLKLDRALVSGLDHDPAKQALIDAIGAFASRIDAWVIAEGVERGAERVALRRLGVPLAQGFLFGRPGRRMVPGRLTRPRPASWRGGGGDLARRIDPLEPVAADALLTAAGRFGAAPHLGFLPVVDERRRPLGLLAREEPTRMRAALRVLPGEPAWVLGERAMTRATAQRFDPLVVCDERGTYVGLLEVEQLVGHLAALARPRAPDEEEER